ncbi:hypothetical protein [Mesorhizobium sp.]|uniref:hypothetical protein n=1 Tax=Mesorhizobium sp. TaxID=1871066 RepID=UPI00121B6CB9|nr:hypothetical protein [Mesorhizobium sp.]TIN82200.1 MAG: hypothetical protein E5X97_31235 [Mesorhizobium sp.]
MSVQPIKAFALVDDDNGISLSHLFTACQRSVWQKELDDLAAKLAQKGATHTMRIVEVIVAPANDIASVMLSALKSAEIATQELCYGQDPANQCWVTLQEIRDAIAKAEGR